LQIDYRPADTIGKVCHFFLGGEKTLPLYAYRCTQCGHRFEKIQNFSAEPELVCPQCHGVLERPLTASRLHFKGAGWYVNDYAPKSSVPASEAGSESGKGAAAAETKAPSAPGEGSASAPAATPAPAPSTTPSSTTPGSTP
jgi:putative FmdB family regulatory protein